MDRSVNQVDDRVSGLMDGSMKQVDGSMDGSMKRVDGSMKQTSGSMDGPARQVDDQEERDMRQAVSQEVRRAMSAQLDADVTRRMGVSLFHLVRQMPLSPCKLVTPDMPIDLYYNSGQRRHVLFNALPPTTEEVCENKTMAPVLWMEVRYRVQYNQIVPYYGRRFPASPGGEQQSKAKLFYLCNDTLSHRRQWMGFKLFELMKHVTFHLKHPEALYPSEVAEWLCEISNQPAELKHRYICKMFECDSSRWLYTEPPLHTEYMWCYSNPTDEPTKFPVARAVKHLGDKWMRDFGLWVLQHSIPCWIGDAKPPPLDGSRVSHFQWRRFWSLPMLPLRRELQNIVENWVINARLDRFDVREKVRRFPSEICRRCVCESVCMIMCVYDHVYESV